MFFLEQGPALYRGSQDKGIYYFDNPHIEEGYVFLFTVT